MGEAREYFMSAGGATRKEELSIAKVMEMTVDLEVRA
jgi:hypothetical protein